MIQKISQLKNFGIFRDFIWRRDVPDLAKFNLIYGWNRSGKTTLSRVFSACEKESIDFKEYPNGSKFELEVKGSDRRINENNCNNLTFQVRVFNRDFVEENLFFDSQGSTAKPIIYVGKEDIKLKQELNKLQNIHETLVNEQDQLQSDYDNKSNQENQFRQVLAKRIKDKLGTDASSPYRNYDKGNIRDKIEDIGIENFIELTPEKCTELENFIASTPPENIQPLSEYNFGFQFDGRSLNGFPEIAQAANTLLSHSITSQTIQRLEEDDEINAWVENGYHLHKSKNEENQCLFCENALKDGFLKSLSKHFSDDYNLLQEKISTFVEKLTSLNDQEKPEENQKILDELKSTYEDKLRDLSTILEEIDEWLDHAISNLMSKREKPLVTMAPIDCSKNFDLLCKEAVMNLNSVINKHNTEVGKHADRIEDGKEKLENHMIASAIRENNYQEIKLDLAALDDKRNEIEDELAENNQKIENLQNQISSIAEAINEINHHLEKFFGRKEIELKLDSSEKGYEIRRNGGHASSLSEGEKNAIAFSYFIVKTREQGFNLKESIIVIDDPVSSFDSNFTYHCFCLLKNSFTSMKQLILLTHNFEVFNLIKNQWFGPKNNKVNNHNNKKPNVEQKSIPCEFFMLKNEVMNQARHAFIEPLHATLRNFDSEYQFLFSELNTFHEKRDNDYSDYYLIGNIARRFLEIFAHLKIPTRSDLRSKINQICHDCRTSNSEFIITEIEMEKLYKLINESSHVRDPVRAFNHTDQSEAKNAISILMKIVKGSDKRHFDCLISEINRDN